MSVTDEQATAEHPPEGVTADLLAQAWGCEPENECYAECAASAQEWLDDWAELDQQERDDVAAAADWLRRVGWIA